MQSLIQRFRTADLHFKPNGTLTISSRVSKLLQLQSKDVIDIVQNGCELYIRVLMKAEQAIGKMQCRCIRSKRTGNVYRIFSKQLYTAICTLTGAIQGEAIRLMCGELTEHGVTIIYKTRI